MMTISAVGLSSNINFREDPVTNYEVKSNLIKSPAQDEFKPQMEAKPKNKHLLRNITLGVISAIALTYGSVVLHRKLSKPSFEEVQKCFKEIFQKDLSDSEVKSLIEKYKQICKNGNTDDFTKKMIEELKKDYGLEQVETTLNIEKLKDNTLITALKRTETGNVTPLGVIKIMPATHGDTIIRSVQGDIFRTGFHELKHVKQFADAYRTDPDKFTEACFNRFVSEDPKFKEVLIKEAKDDARKIYTKMKNHDKETMKTYHVTEEAYNNFISKRSVDDLIKWGFEESGLKLDEDIYNRKKERIIKNMRKLLDKRYGKLERFKEGTEEYKKGLEYIEGYEKYPDAKKDYDAYKNNILEKEAWHNGDLAQKIYKYISSIWKL